MDFLKLVILYTWAYSDLVISITDNLLYYCILFIYLLVVVFIYCKAASGMNLILLFLVHMIIKLSLLLGTLELPSTRQGFLIEQV